MVAYGQLTGSVLHGTFSLIRLIGEGGMGTVYEAVHQRLDRRFAVKVLHRKASDDPVTVARFQREAQITSNLGSKHIVDVVDFNITEDGVRYIVMELLEGEDLETRIGRCGKLALQQAALIAEQVVAALYSAHRSGIVHRDLKPSNVFVCRQEEGEVVKVLDFGISKILGDQVASITTENSLVGTPHYMAPEQIMDDEVDYRVDVWATGAIIYEMLAGLPPFHSPRIPTVLQKIVNEDPYPLSFHVKDLPEGLESVVMRALSKKPDDRPPSIRAFWRELADAAGLPYRDFSSSWPESEGEPSYPSLPSTLDVTNQASRGPAMQDQQTQRPQPQASLAQQRDVIKPNNNRLSGFRRSSLVLLGGLFVLAVGALVLFASTGNDPRPETLKSASAEAPRRDFTAFAKTPADIGPPPMVDAGATKPPTRRAIWLQTKPSGASVRIRGGRTLGKTPLRGAIIGTDATVLLVTARGYRPRQISIGKGHVKIPFEPVTLKPLPPATLQISVLDGATPVSAQVYLDDKSVGQSGLVLKNLRPGAHVVEARWQGSSTRRALMLEPGKTFHLSLKLEPADGDQAGTTQ